MQGDTLKSGTCPKCSLNDEYTDREFVKRGERMQLVVSSWKEFFLDTYVCLSCGHFEEFVRESELRNEKTIEKLKETWKKI